MSTDPDRCSIVYATQNGPWVIDITVNDRPLHPDDSRTPGDVILAGYAPEDFASLLELAAAAIRESKPGTAPTVEEMRAIFFPDDPEGAAAQ